VKQRINISLSSDTADRLKQYAWEHHTNVSQAITDWIWSAKVKNEQIRGQQTIDGIMSEEKRRRKAGQ
jgi:hypothetical protein